MEPKEGLVSSEDNCGAILGKPFSFPKPTQIILTIWINKQKWLLEEFNNFYKDIASVINRVLL